MGTGRWRGTLCAAALLSVACAGPPLDFPDWQLEVPDGTPVHEYAGTPLEERPDSLGLIKDLVIGGEDGDLDKAFFNPISVAVDPADGNIFVFDSGNVRIQVFDRDGNYLQTLGGEGEGPGGLSRGGGRMTIAGDFLVHILRTRMTVWNLEGELVAAIQQPLPLFSDIVGLPDARLVGFTWERPEEGVRLKAFRRMNLDGEIEHEYMRIADDGPPVFRRPNSFLSSRAPVGEPQFAAAPDGNLYFTPADDYQVLATDAAGAPRWALRVAWARIPITDDDIDGQVARVRERMPDASRDEIDWPTHRPALERSGSIAVDGHGRLFVFPYVPEDWAEDWVPVDVYSADGAALFSGRTAPLGWRAAYGDFIYSLEPDPITEETVLVRYRLPAF